MTFAFATCERKTALGFIQKFHQVTADDIPDLLDAIAADKLRVLDPDFHSPCQIVAGTHFDESERVELEKLAYSLLKFPSAENAEAKS